MSLNDLIKEVHNARRIQREKLYFFIMDLENEAMSNPELLKEIDEQAMSKQLQSAVKYTRTRFIKLIAEFGNRNHLSSLERAVILGNVNLAESLLENGERFIPKWDDHHLGDYIFQNKNMKDRKEMVKVLIKYGFAEFRSKKGENILHIFLSSVEQKDEDAWEVAVLLNSGILIDEFCSRKFTPLLLAILSENILLVEFLIKRGVDVNQKDKFLEVSPLTMAARLLNIKIMDLLLSKGATDVNSRVINLHGEGPTVLHSACRVNSVKIIDCLLRKGADACVDYGDGKTPFSVLNPDKRGYNESMIVLIKEFSKLTLENLPVSSIDLDLIQKNSKAQEHFQNCKAELEKMASTKFYVPYSYYSVMKMSKNIKKLACLTKNKEFVAKFKANLKVFTYYESDLQRIFEEALLVKDRSEEVEKRLRNALGVSLPDLVITKLGKNLSVEDLPIE